MGLCPEIFPWEKLDLFCEQCVSQVDGQIQIDLSKSDQTFSSSELGTLFTYLGPVKVGCKSTLDIFRTIFMIIADKHLIGLLDPPEITEFSVNLRGKELEIHVKTSNAGRFELKETIGSAKKHFLVHELRKLSYGLYRSLDRFEDISLNCKVV